jgi:hypothetical protein
VVSTILLMLLGNVAIPALSLSFKPPLRPVYRRPGNANPLLIAGSMAKCHHLGR